MPQIAFSDKLNNLKQILFVFIVNIVYTFELHWKISIPSFFSSQTFLNKYVIDVTNVIQPTLGISPT